MKKHITAQGVEFNTTGYNHRGRVIWINSRKFGGIRALIWNAENTKVEKVIRFSYIKPEELLKKAKHWIDLHYPLEQKKD